MPVCDRESHSLVNSTDDARRRHYEPANAGNVLGATGGAGTRGVQVAATAQARDQIEIANLSTADVRTDIAVATAQDLSLDPRAEAAGRSQPSRAPETAMAHLDYARRRLEVRSGHAAQRAACGTGSRHEPKRGSRTRSLGSGARGSARVLIASNGPPMRPPSRGSIFRRRIEPEASWMAVRPDLRLFVAQEHAADRVWRDSSKDWFPTAIASFATDPQALVRRASSARRAAGGLS